MTVGLPLMKNVLASLNESGFVPLRLAATASATDAAIQKKFFGLGVTALIMSNKEMNDIMKIVKSLKKSGLLIKGVSETIKNEIKEQKDGSLGMLLGTFVASLLGNMLSRKGVVRRGDGVIRAGEGTNRTNQDFNATSPFNYF